MLSDLNPFLEKSRPLNFRKLNLSPKLRVALLAPHPDDFDAIGITMKILHENGNKIHLGVLTSGSRGVDDKTLSVQEKSFLREQEQISSCNFFGLPQECLTFLHLDEDDENHIQISEGNLERLKSFLEAHSPDVIFMPHGNDTNKEHQRTYLLFRKLMETSNRSIVALLSKDPKTIEMKHDLYTEFDDEEAKWKAELLRHHKSQHERNLRARQHGFDERILNVNRTIALESGLFENYAEVFEIELYLLI